MTFEFSNEGLEFCAEGYDLPFPDIPHHSLNCERTVQNVAKVTMKAIGRDRRHNALLATTPRPR